MNKVLIVGRMNVGKSTLFNRLSSEVKSLTLDFAGVTRDFIKDVVNWKNVSFELIDSGGLKFGKAKTELEQKVIDVALRLVQEADLVLFVCDGTTGPVNEEREIAKILHKANKNVVLIINKIDSKLSLEHEHEFQQLGFKNMLPISAQHAINIGDLLDVIVELLGPAKKEKEEEPLYKVVLLGKPNVGKSSLLNLMLDEERSIVSQEPGTTREPVSEKIRFYKESIQLTDTAGIRRKRAVKEEIENLMVKSSFAAVKDSDIVLLLIDASEARISDQELKLSFYVFEQGKALIILFNKQDLMDNTKLKDLKFSLEEYEYFFDKIETLNISCKTQKNIGKILPLVDEVYKKYSSKFSDIDLTALYKNALKRTPLYHKSLPLIVYHAKQVKTAPITILLHVNEPKWFGESQRTFFENVMRSKYDLKGVPILFMFRKKV